MGIPPDGTPYGEPKPDVAIVMCPCVKGEYCAIHSKPDEGRLLTDEVIEEIENEYPRKFGIGKTVAKAQDAKTASIKDKEWLKALNQAKDATSLSFQVKDAECQERVERLFRKIDRKMPLEHYENEGFHHVQKDCLLCWWQALKKKELK